MTREELTHSFHFSQHHRPLPLLSHRVLWLGARQIISINDYNADQSQLLEPRHAACHRIELYIGKRALNLDECRSTNNGVEQGSHEWVLRGFGCGDGLGRMRE